MRPEASTLHVQCESTLNYIQQLTRPMRIKADDYDLVYLRVGENEVISIYTSMLQGNLDSWRRRAN